MDQRTQFIADYLRGCLSITELCALYDVSRKTGYKWIDRYLHYGPAGLDERSRKPRASPNQTDPAMVSALLEMRRRHPSWGAKKLLTLLHKSHPRWELPGRSTVCDILSRHGMVPKQRQHRRIGPPGKPTTSILAPNVKGVRIAGAHSYRQRRSVRDRHLGKAVGTVCLVGAIGRHARTH